MRYEIVFHWIAVAVYAISTLVFVYSLTFHKDRFRLGVILAAAGLVPHTLALGIRWIITGHGPYLRVYEVYSSDVWVAILVYLLVQKWKPGLRVIGVVVMPVALLLIGLAMMASPEIRELPETFRTYWLMVHIFFAKFAYSSLLLGTGCSILILVKKRYETRGGWYKKIPALDILDELAYSFTGFGFLMLAVMIVAGSIWANNAWGSYWSWDPVETWSLISWLVYGIYLHLRRTRGWRGARLAWLSVFSFGVLAFALFGIGIFYFSTHSPYISG
ncbi:MAG: cytochrome c biogenesis protein CcsA [Firmicutes bacterium]|nr:cytochrome c biogenesis protein CcsA [Bacillota bacterium]